MRRLGPFRLFVGLLLALVALYVVVPLTVVILQSFNPRLTLFPEEFTTRWYQMRAGGLGSAVTASLAISIPSMVIGVLVSLPLGYALTRYEFRGKEIVRQLLVLPIIVPGVVLGLAYLQLLNSTPLRSLHPLAILVLAHTVIVIPYAARPIVAGFQALDASLEEASASLGSRPLGTFGRVMLPMLVPAMLSGGILGFARSINDFIITLFLVQPGFIPLSVQVYQTTQYGLPQLTSAMGTVLLMFSVVFVTFAELLLRMEVER